jgi:hypothetical protein
MLRYARVWILGVVDENSDYTNYRILNAYRVIYQRARQLPVSARPQAIAFLPPFFSTFVTLSWAVEGGILGLILPLFLAKSTFRV